MLRPNSEDGIIRLGTVDSVLTSARQFASIGCLDPFDSVTAVEQTAGRGQYGRTWQSPAGNIYAALRLPQVPPFTTTAAATAVSAVIADVLAQEGWNISLKWPNDLVVTRDGFEYKVGGVLLEERGDLLTAGIGINLANHPDAAQLREGAALTATSLMDCAGPETMPSADELWARIADRFKSLFLPDFAYSWRRLASPRLLWLNSHVRLDFADGGFDTGLLKGIGPEGDLIILNSTGTHTYLEGSLSRAQ